MSPSTSVTVMRLQGFGFHSLGLALESAGWVAHRPAPAWGLLDVGATVGPYRAALRNQHWRLEGDVMQETPSTRAARLHSTAELAVAEDPGALLRHLLGSSHEHAEFNSFDAVAAFKRVHRTDRDDAHRTAVLLCTDPRWRRTTKALIAAIVDSGIVSDDALDDLAGWFLADEELWIHVPVTLLDPEAVETADATVPLWRRVAPPLVGWAAAHATRRDGQRAAESLLAGLNDRTTAHAGAVLNGLIGVLDVLPGGVAGRILDRALSWPVAGTRTVAIRHLHAHGDAGRAIRLARADPARSIRRLAERLQRQLRLRGGPEPGPTEGRRPAEDTVADAADPPSTAATQPGLFPE